MKPIGFSVFLLLWFMVTQSQVIETSPTHSQFRSIPTGYYNTALNLTCGPLKTALKNIVTTGHTPQTYGALWTRFLTNDVKLREVAPAAGYNNSTQVIWDIYSDIPNSNDPYNFTPGIIASGGQQDDGSLGSLEGQRYNREHSVPSSWFNGNTNTPGVATDYIFIFPCDKRNNTLRSNDLYGKVGTAGTISTTLNGSKSGLSEIGLGYPAVRVFEPIDSFKGDVARAFFYFVTRYQDNIPGWSGNSFAFDNSTYPSIEANYLTMMKNWHILDPVSTKEINRNDASYLHQGNRNPYIDSPQYVTKVWDVTCLASLPVNFTLFNVKQINQHALIHWNTANEQDVQQYIIEKSYDGILFHAIGAVNKNNLQNYHFIDPLENEIHNTIFYRVKKRGLYSQHFSEIIKLELSKPNYFTVYQNGIQNQIVIKFKNTIREKALIQLYDNQGKLMFQQASFLNETNTKLALPNLTKGIYFISIKCNAFSKHQKLLIQ